MPAVGWRQTASRHPYATIGLCFAVIIFIVIALIAVTGIGGELTLLEKQLFLMTISISAVLAALGFGLVLIFDKVQLNAVETILEHLPTEEPSIKLLSDPNEIWRLSIELLNKLIHEERAQNKHAYDVTTYMNKILYEEHVVNVLNSGIIFDRIFCFDVESKRPSDKAVMWFYNKIFEGGEVTYDEIKDFESEIAKAFNGGEHLSDEDIKRLEDVIDKLHKARIQGKLRISHNPYPQHTDFVVIKYTPQGATSEEHEVVANFKTDPMGLTYTIGIHGTKRIALEYKNMFESILFKPIS